MAAVAEATVAVVVAAAVAAAVAVVAVADESVMSASAAAAVSCTAHTSVIVALSRCSFEYRILAAVTRLLAEGVCSSTSQAADTSITLGPHASRRVARVRLGWCCGRSRTGRVAAAAAEDSELDAVDGGETVQRSSE